jgi:hypothetical protein
MYKVLADNIPSVLNVTPQRTGLPGGGTAIGFLSGVIFYSLILTMVGVVLSAGLWAVGAFSNNYTQSINGKKGFLICASAALAVGGSYGLIQWFFTQGGRLNK